MAPSKYRKLAGKHVIVIGGSSGIGYGIAEASLESGAHVTISSSSQAKIDAAVASLKGAYPNQNIQGFAADLSTTSAEQELEAIFKKAGKPHHVVFTAADSLSLMMLQDLTPEKIHQACHMRLVVPLMAAKVASRYLDKNNESSITITSGSAAYKSTPGWSVVSYFAAGLQGMVRQLAVEIAPVRINAVSPGYTDTGLWSHMTKEDKDGFVRGFESTVPTGRFGQVEDVVEAYVWLMKDKNATGTVASSDSGYFLV